MSICKIASPRKTWRVASRKRRTFSLPSRVPSLTMLMMVDLLRRRVCYKPIGFDRSSSKKKTTRRSLMFANGWADSSSRYTRQGEGGARIDNSSHAGNMAVFSVASFHIRGGSSARRIQKPCQVLFCGRARNAPVHSRELLPPACVYNDVVTPFFQRYPALAVRTRYIASGLSITIYQGVPSCPLPLEKFLNLCGTPSAPLDPLFLLSRPPSLSGRGGSPSTHMFCPIFSFAMASGGPERET